MQTTRQILSVFLASPSDVTEERKATQEVVDTINSTVSRDLGWSIDLLVWENTSPGYGRPQELINPLVDVCGLFIGLLWERWGQPSGEHTSGFEEEFERARKRRKSEGHPEIWLIFKTLPADRLRDVGPQLKKVLEFKKSQIERREVLYKEVQDTEDWRRKLHSWLLTYLIKLASPGALALPQSSAVNPNLESSVSSDLELSLANTTANVIPQQLVALASLFNRVVQSGNMEFSLDEAHLVQEFDVIRLFLLSSTWLSKRNTGDLLGTREINLLYKYRDKLQATAPEYAQLMRTLVADKGDVVPGWFWFQELSEDALRSVFLSLASQDSAEGVGVRAMQLLTQAKILIDPKNWNLLPLDDGSSSAVRNAIYKYLASFNDQRALAFIESLRGQEPTQNDVGLYKARLRLLAKLEPGKAAAELIHEDRLDDHGKILAECISQASDDSLLNGVETSNSAQVRNSCLLELKRRGKVSISLAKKLTDDPSLKVKSLAFDILAGYGALDIDDLYAVRKALEPETPEGRSLSMLSLLAQRSEIVAPTFESIILTFYRTQPTEKLLQAVVWSSVNSPLAYRVLATDRRDEIAFDVRCDVADGFARIKKDTYARNEAELGTQYAQKHQAEFAEFDDFIQSRFTAEALLLLARNGEASDAALARPYLQSDDKSLRDPAVDIISKFGTAADVERLIEIATESWGDVCERAASAALRLAPDPFDVALRLVTTNNSEVAQTAFDWLYSQESRDVQGVFIRFLHDESEKNRVRAVYYLSRTLDHHALASALETYLGAHTYYFNVVTWFDRLLYSPSPLRNMYESLLQREATGVPKP